MGHGSVPSRHAQHAVLNSNGGAGPVDPQGASVPGAAVAVVQSATGQRFQVVTDEKGYWALPSLQNGTYKVTVSHAGFKSANSENVVLDAGVPATGTS